VFLPSKANISSLKSQYLFPQKPISLPSKANISSLKSQYLFPQNTVLFYWLWITSKTYYKELLKIILNRMPHKFKQNHTTSKYSLPQKTILKTCINKKFLKNDLKQNTTHL